MEGFWTGVSACAALGIAGLSIYQWYKSRVVLKAELKIHPFALPIELQEAFSQFFRLEHYLERLAIENAPEETTTRVREAVRNLLDTLKKFELIYSTRINYFAEVDLQNHGSEEIQKIEIKVDNTLCMEAIADGKWVAKDNANSAINIRPGEKLNFRLWSAGWSKKIAILQSRGRADVVDHIVIPAPEFHALKNFKSRAILVGVMISVFLTILGGELLKKSSS